MFCFLVWLVVIGKIGCILSSRARHDRSTIADIRCETEIIYEQSDDSTRATSIKHVVSSSRELFHCVQEVELTLPEPIDNRLSRISREF